MEVLIRGVKMDGFKWWNWWNKLVEQQYMHTHKDNIHSANGKIVCNDCIKKEDLNGNQCFDLCHQKGKDSCLKCSVFHR